jgi:hypothetical protein
MDTAHILIKMVQLTNKVIGLMEIFKKFDLIIKFILSKKKTF